MLGYSEDTLRAGDRTYPCMGWADDGTSALAVTFELTAAMAADRESAIVAALERLNEDLPLGSFVLAAGAVRYQARLEVEDPLLNQDLVIESLRAAVSLMHRHAPDLPLLLEH